MILLPFLMVYPLSLVTAMYLVKSLKEMPVHFSVGSTPDTYAHITTAAQKEAAKAMGKVTANALRKVGTARMRRRRVRASFLPRMGQGIGCVWTLLVDLSCRNSECKMNAAISFEQGLTISPAVLRQGDDARKLKKSKSKRCIWIQHTDIPLKSPQALHSITLVTRANQPDAIAFNGLQIRLRGQAVCNDGI